MSDRIPGSHLRIPALLEAIARTIVKKGLTGGPFSRRTLNFIDGSGVTITLADDDPNEAVNITIAATAADAVTPAQLRRDRLTTYREWSCGNGGGGQTLVTNTLSISITGTLASVYGASCVYQSLTTTTGIANEAGFDAAPTVPGAVTNIDWTLYCHVRTPADRTNSRTFVGLGQNGVTNSDTIGNDSILWRLSPADTKWTLIGKATGAQEVEATGPTVADSTEYVLRARHDQSAAIIYGAVSTDGGVTWSAETQVATIPTAGVNLAPVTKVVNVAGVVTASMQWSSTRVFFTLDPA